MTDHLKRNPYVILGIPYGSTASQARKGFAVKTRYLRRVGTAAAYNESDLTWALHQIEQAEADHGSRLDVYRIPADPEATATDQEGLFNPPPEQWRPQPHRSVEDVIDDLETEARLFAYLEHLAANPPQLPDPLLKESK